jgi:selenocysteine-specific elongation factor
MNVSRSKGDESVALGMIIDASMRDLVIGTAGHVDHGKSALVKALTGVDPDRLPAEKARGMTIDLGFALLTLPSGRRVSFVDVPGHERFVANMVAGATGIDAGLLVVAADEGVMPQTREHVDILDLLGVAGNLIAITKCDLVEDDMLEIVREDVAALVDGTVFEGAPMVAVSSVTGFGMELLVQELEMLAGGPRLGPEEHHGPRDANVRRNTADPGGRTGPSYIPDDSHPLGPDQHLEPREISARRNVLARGRREGPSYNDDRLDGVPRLPVDRVFTTTGFGTVVTGTVVGDSFARGHEVEIAPKGVRARIRGVQAHGASLSRSRPAGRVALNLAGADRRQIDRGDVVTIPHAIPRVTRFDALVRVLPGSPVALSRNQAVTIHAGAAQLQAMVFPLEGDILPAGSSGWLQVRLARPGAVWRRQRFIVRIPSPSRTVAGGVIADLAPRRRAHDDQMTRLEALLSDDLETAIAGAVSDRKIDAERLAQLLTVSGDRIGSCLAALEAGGRVRRLGRTYVGPDPLADIQRRAEAILATYHERFPRRAFMPREEVRQALRMDQVEFDDLVHEMMRAGVIEVPSSTFNVQRSTFKVQRSEFGVQSSVPTVQSSEFRVQSSELGASMDGPLSGGSGLGLALSRHAARSAEAASAPASDPAEARFLEMLDAAKLQPPPVSDLLSQARMDREGLRRLVQTGRVVRVDETVYVTREAHERLVGEATNLLAREGAFTIARLRDALETSRKYALAFAAHLDDQHITRRAGNERVADPRGVLRNLRAHSG